MIRLSTLKKLDTKEKIKIFGPTILILLVGFVLAYQFVAPAPPRSITIGTGSREGAYFDYAKTYRELLAEDGIELNLRNTAGSAENLKLLEAESGGVDIAFVQGGLKHLSKTDKLVSLGSLFFEPLWIFHRNGIELKRLPDLRGLRIAVGAEGGGFEREGEFPAPKYLDFELSEQAERFYQIGPPFLQRYLSFWVATFLTRMKIMLLPLIVLLFPLFKIVPLAYRWKMRSKIYRWYSKLEAVDPKIHKKDLPEHLNDYIRELDLIEEQVSSISVPLAYSDELYALRLHIGMLRNELLRVRESKPQDQKGGHNV